MAEEGSAKAKLFAWARGVARRWSAEEQAGRAPSLGLKMQHGLADKQAREMVQGYVAELNEGLNRWERIGRFHILDQDLTIEGGELTPSMKLRRKIAAERYSEHLDGMYVDQ